MYNIDCDNFLEEVCIQIDNEYQIEINDVVELYNNQLNSIKDTYINELNHNKIIQHNEMNEIKSSYVVMQEELIDYHESINDIIESEKDTIQHYKKGLTCLYEYINEKRNQYHKQIEIYKNNEVNYHSTEKQLKIELLECRNKIQLLNNDIQNYKAKENSLKLNLNIHINLNKQLQRGKGCNLNIYIDIYIIYNINIK